MAIFQNKDKQSIFKWNKLIILWLLGFYILSFGFIDIFELPIIGKKLQLPEIIFISLVIVLIPAFFNSFPNRNFKNEFSSPIAKALSLFFLAILFSTIYHHRTKNIIEFIGLLYLLSLFFILKRVFLETLIKHKKRILQYFNISALLLGISGILGWILTQNGIETQLAFSSERYYPYLGYIGRAKGGCPTPALYVNILGSLFLLKFAQYMIIPKRRDNLVLITLLFGIILSFSKSIILLIISCLVILKVSKSRIKFSNYFFYPTILALFLFFNLATHFIVINPQKIQIEKTLQDQTFIAKEPVAVFGDFWLVETNYALMKKSNSIAFFRNPIFGVGLGGHNEFVNKLGNEPKYHTEFQGEKADPHSTYFGTFSEIGLFGGLTLLILIWIIFKEIKFLISIENKKYPELIFGFLGIFSFLLLEGISTDLLNFRHIWVLLAFLEAILILEKRNLKINKT